MPNVSEKKLKLLYLLQMLWERTDPQHTLSLPQMLEELKGLGIQAERKSLYDDLETLRKFGIQIETRRGNGFGYYIGKREFSQEELNLVAAALEEAPGFSRQQAVPLIRKLGSALGSAYQAQALLSREEGREPLSEGSLPQEEPAPAPEWEALLKEAMERDVQVTLERVRWRLDPTGELIRAQEEFPVSPWRLLKRGEVPVLWAYDGKGKKACPVPLPEITCVRLLDRPREGEKSLPAKERLVLELPASLLDEAARFFHGELSIEPFGKGKVRAVVRTQLDGELFAWLFSHGPEIRLTAPKKAAEQFRERAKSLAKAYKS